MTAQSKSRIGHFEPSHSISLWLHHINTEQQLRQWLDPMAVAEATWFLTNCGQSTTWADFEASIHQCFGDNEQTILVHVQHRKQQESESVQSYADDMNMLFAQSAFPDAMRMDIMLDNLKPSLRRRVATIIPISAE